MNARHAQFVQEYLVDLNATQAYRRVYPRVKPQTAEVNGCKLLSNAKIAAAVAAATAERIEKTKVDAAWVVTQLRAEATDRGDGSSHSGRVRALELLGRHLSIFVDRLKIEGGVTLEVVEEIVDARDPKDGPTPPRAG